MIKKIYHSLVPEKRRNQLLLNLHKLNALRYRGDNFYCNCCERSFSRFLPYGNTPRPNAACPYCHSLERVRLLWHYLQTEVKIQTAPLSLLHFAPENGLQKKLMRLPNIRYYDADLNPALARHVVDITAIPFADNSFDLIICAHVLGHVPDEALAIREMHRVLKPDGLCLVMTVIDPTRAETYSSPTVQTPADRLRHYGEHDLVRLHGRDFAQRLSAQGFQVTPRDYRLELSPALAQRYSLGNGDREVIFECRK